VTSREETLAELLIEVVQERMTESDNVLGRDLHRMFHGKKTAEEAAIVMALEHIRQAIRLLTMLGGIRHTTPRAPRCTFSTSPIRRFSDAATRRSTTSCCARSATSRPRARERRQDTPLQHLRLNSFPTLSR
jgi:hypothetical protein